jgi:hypothetical protein
MTDMLWHKSWLETRSRFLVGLILLTVMTCGTVFEYPTVAALMPLAREIKASGAVGRLVKEAIDIERDYRGYIWTQLFRQNLAQMATLFAALLGSGGLLAQRSGGGALFTLSLPVSRSHVLRVRAATGLAELVAIAIVPSLIVPLLSPSIGQAYGIGGAIVHGVCAFAGAAVFLSLACWLSTIFSDMWRPLLLTCAAAILLAGLEFVLRDTSVSGVFSVMTGQRYFQSGQIPWLGAAVCVAVSAGMLLLAERSLERCDF